MYDIDVNTEVHDVGIHSPDKYEIKLDYVNKNNMYQYDVSNDTSRYCMEKVEESKNESGSLNHNNSKNFNNKQLRMSQPISPMKINNEEINEKLSPDNHFKFDEHNYKTGQFNNIDETIDNYQGNSYTRVDSKSNFNYTNQNNKKINSQIYNKINNQRLKYQISKTPKNISKIENVNVDSNKNRLNQ